MKMSKRKTEIISKSCNSVTTYSNCREQKVERWNIVQERFYWKWI